MNILIIEEDKKQLEVLIKLIMQYCKDWIIYNGTSIEEAKRVYLAKEIDLLITEVEVGDIGSEYGFIFAKEIRQYSQYTNLPIIFVTSVREMIYKAINTIHCYSYITKPYIKEEIHKILDDIMSMDNYKGMKLKIKDKDGVYLFIPMDTIYYVESDRHTLEIFTNNGATKCNNLPLNEIIKKLSKNFIRIHKKYIVNIEHVSNYDKTNGYVTVNENHIPVGRVYKKNFENIFLSEN